VCARIFLIFKQYDSRPQNASRLFFPFASPHRIMEFAAYLSYLGVPVERVTATRHILIVGNKIQRDGPCEGYSPSVCHPGSKPETGDFIVMLPDDLARPDGSNSHEEEGTQPLLSYHPFPSIPERLRPYVDHLHVVSPVYPRRLPEHWLDASLRVWK
jgi:hypothetical protein